MRSPGSTSGKAGSSNFATSGDSPLKRRPKRWASRPRPSPGTGGSRGRGCAGSLADDDALFRLGVTLEFAHLLANQISSIHRRHRLESAASHVEPNAFMKAELFADASYAL